MTTAAATGVGTWTIDPAHSGAEFAVRHMMVSTVRGRFLALEGTLRIDEDDPTASSVTASIGTASVSTGQEQRDAHLRSDDFFAAEQYPAMTFVSKRVESDGDGAWKVTGDLTIRDVTREVVLDTQVEGDGIDAFGKRRAGFTATATINRKDFGLNWNGVIETGGVVVGDKVKVTLDIAAVRAD